MQKIETTLGALVNAEAALRRISEQDGLTARTKYRVVKLVNLVASEVQGFQAARQGLFATLGAERPARTEAERQQHGPTLREIPAEKMPEFTAQFAQLLEEPVTIDWAPIRSVDLPQAKASDYVDLGPLCELVEPSE